MSFFKKETGSLRKKYIYTIRTAGLGDMLYQINTFFWCCDTLDVEPSINYDIASIKHRNLTSGITITEFVGIDSLLEHTNQKDTEITVPYSEFLTWAKDQLPVDRGQSNDPVFVKYAQGEFEYDHDFLFSKTNVLKTRFYGLTAHPKLQKAIINSPLAKKVRSSTRTNRKGKKRLLVHVRRGDVAIAKADLLKELLKNKNTDDLFVHYSGFHKKEAINSSNRQRHTSTKKTLKALKALNNLDIDISTYHITFASDGFTRLSDHLHNKYKNAFEEGVKKEDILHALDHDFNDLTKMADQCIIGEGDKLLFQTLTAAISADIIVSHVPHLFKLLGDVLNENLVIINENLVIKSSNK
jgi:hypothetical protein